MLKMMLRFNIISLIIILFSSCQENKNDAKLTSNGIWKQQGYGKIFEIHNDSVRIYDICKVGCIENEYTPLIGEGKIESFSKDALTIRKNIKTYEFVRLEKLPELCTKNNADSQNPNYNFEVLWHTFNEHYCYFEKRTIDWQEKYKSYSARITAETGELELFQIFDDLLNSLNDGHVDLDWPETIADTLKILKQKEIQPKKEQGKVSRFQLADEIADFYCKDFKTHNAGITKWGMMKNNIAYVQINAMWLLAYYELPKQLSLGELAPLYAEIMDTKVYQRQDEIDGANLLMDTIVQDLKQADALVLDLRFNTGGKDEAGLEIIGHLVQQPLKIATKKAKRGNGFTNHQQIYIDNRNPSFTRKVYVLTSHVTASAAEVAVLATLQYDNFVRIGSNTEGIFSDGLDKKLPNGWEYTLSNEIYEDIDGNNYEGLGITPDIDLKYPKDKGEFINLVLGQLKENGDEAIERVFTLEAAKK